MTGKRVWPIERTNILMPYLYTDGQSYTTVDLIEQEAFAFSQRHHLLEQDYQVSNYQNVQFFTALETQNLKTLQLLLDAGYNPNTPDYTSPGLRPLQDCAQRGWVQGLLLLLHYGADPELTDSEGWTPLMSAAAFGESDSVECLLSAGARPLRSIPRELKNEGASLEALAFDNQHRELADRLKHARLAWIATTEAASLEQALTSTPSQLPSKLSL